MLQKLLVDLITERTSQGNEITEENENEDVGDELLDNSA